MKKNSIHLKYTRVISTIFFFIISFFCYSFVSAETTLEEIISAPQPRIKIPGLNFTDGKTVAGSLEEKTGPSGAGQYIDVPYLGEYLAAMFRLAVVSASILAVIFIIIGGFIWTTSGGNPQRIDSAKKMIGRSLSGLIIAVSSYVILFTINPELVEFKSLEIKLIAKEEMDFGPNTITQEQENQSVASGPYVYKYFNECPVKLENLPFFDDKNTEKPGDIRKNIARRIEFHEKIISQNILKGTVSERLLMGVEAAARCKIHYENCGVGTTNMYALALKNQNKKSTACLKNTDTVNPCNSLGGGFGRTMLYDVLGTKTDDDRSLNSRLSGLWCGGKVACCPKNKKDKETPAYTAKREACIKKIEETCIPDKTEAQNKLRSILAKTKWSPDWVDELQPGDYYMLVNWNPSCKATHSAMFLGWKGDKANRTASVQMGDAGNFLRIGTQQFGDNDFVIQISRPKD